MEKGLVVLIEQLPFLIRDIRALTVPCHQHLRQYSSIHRLAGIFVWWSGLTALGDETAVRVSRLEGLPKSNQHLVITSQVPRLYCALRIGVDADPISKWPVGNFVEPEENARSVSFLLTHPFRS